MLRKLESFIDDAAFRHDWRAVKHANKQRLATYVARTPASSSILAGCSTSRSSASRIQAPASEVLHIGTLYAVKKNPALAVPPRAFIFGARRRRLFHGQTHQTHQCCCREGECRSGREHAHEGRFVPNFNVQNAHLIYPPPICPSRSPRPARRRLYRQHESC